MIKVGWVPPLADAWVPLPETIIVKKPEFAYNLRLMTHELEHVHQYRRYGRWFWLVYFIGWVTGGFSYRNNWMEREARAALENHARIAEAKRWIREYREHSQP